MVKTPDMIRHSILYCNGISMSLYSAHVKDRDNIDIIVPYTVRMYSVPFSHIHIF